MDFTSIILCQPKITKWDDFPQGWIWIPSYEGSVSRLSQEMPRQDWVCDRYWDTLLSRRQKKLEEGGRDVKSVICLILLEEAQRESWMRSLKQHNKKDFPQGCLSVLKFPSHKRPVSSRQVDFTASYVQSLAESCPWVLWVWRRYSGGFHLSYKAVSVYDFCSRRSEWHIFSIASLGNCAKEKLLF